MKRQALRIFLFAIAGMFISCSTDDAQPLSTQSAAAISASNRPAPNEPVSRAPRLKKVTQITHYNSTESDNSITDYIYNGNQLTGLHIVSDSNVYDVQYHYVGQKLTEAIYFENGAYDGQTTIHYTGNVLSYVLSGTNQSERTEYAYSGGHLYTVKSYYPAGPNESLNQSSTYTYSGNNVSQKLSYIQNGGTGRTFYTYDGMNSPLKNMNKYFQLLSVQEGFDGLSANNPVTWSSYFPVEITTPQNQYHVMVYNSANYPTSIKRYNEGSNSIASDTTIEYE